MHFHSNCKIFQLHIWAAQKSALKQTYLHLKIRISTQFLCSKCQIEVQSGLPWYHFSGGMKAHFICQRYTLKQNQWFNQNLLLSDEKSFLCEPGTRNHEGIAWICQYSWPRSHFLLLLSYSIVHAKSTYLLWQQMKWIQWKTSLFNMSLSCYSELPVWEME